MIIVGVTSSKQSNHITITVIVSGINSTKASIKAKRVDAKRDEAMQQRTARSCCREATQAKKRAAFV